MTPPVSNPSMNVAGNISKFILETLQDHLYTHSKHLLDQNFFSYQLNYEMSGIKLEAFDTYTNIIETRWKVTPA